MGLIDDYPVPAFHFQVRFTSPKIADTSFQEVSGLTQELEVEEVAEGGENSFVHKLPSRLKVSNLVLKRGVALIASPLVQWCKASIEGGLAKPIEPKNLLVFLLNEDGAPARTWSVSNAYPVKVDVGPFDAVKGEVAIEQIELAHSALTRTA